MSVSDDRARSNEDMEKGGKKREDVSASNELLLLTTSNKRCTSEILRSSKREECSV
jgi:hypothetical protein